MSKQQAWLTPDNAPANTKCWRVFIPDGEKWEAAFRGAIRLLAIADNWEQFGSLTPDEAAQEFVDANFMTYEMRPCMAVGTVFMFGGTSAPDGSLVCDGAGYSASDYEKLFDILGYAFGGSGSTFNVPDLRKKFALGSGNGVSVGDTGGLENVTLTEAQMPSHNHSIDTQIRPTDPVGVSPTYGWTPTPFLQTNSAGGDQPHTNMPPYAGLLHCIAYR